MKEKIDWSPIVKIVLDDLLYSQKELADICKVTQQTVSNWRTGVRSPSTKAKRKMLVVINESGYEVPEENRPFGLTRTGTPESNLEELQLIFKDLSEPRRRALLEFAKFQLNQK
jgi:transcriptional regulator with XRE-family HTH domain